MPNAGDFKTNFVGDTPVVLSRDADGSLHAWVNRCAHRGALVCRELRGNSASGTHTCVYHQWAYDNRGNLVGVPFRKGLGGKGGYPADFDMAKHGLQQLRVECVESMVFATFDDQAEPLHDYLGPVMLANIRRVLGRPIELLGTTRQHMRGNWKLYAENTRDSYHGALLHLFYPTFGIYRPAQDSAAVMDEGHRFHNLFQIMTSGAGGDVSEYQNKGMRAMPAADSLADSRVIEFKDDYADGISLTIQSLFPNVVLQQIQNTLATRQIVHPRHRRHRGGVDLLRLRRAKARQCARIACATSTWSVRPGSFPWKTARRSQIVQQGLAGVDSGQRFGAVDGRRQRRGPRSTRHGRELHPRLLARLPAIHAAVIRAVLGAMWTGNRLRHNRHPWRAGIGPLRQHGGEAWSR